MPITLKRLDGTEIVTYDVETVRDAVIKATRTGISLYRADLRGSNFRGSNFSGSDLRDSNFSGSNLRGSDLSGSDLRDSNFSGSDLRGSDLSGSNFRGSNLSGSDLRGSNFSGSNLSGSNLSDSNLSGSNLIGLRDIADAIRVPSLHRRILAAIEAGGELHMGNWHSCETTHCRAGWAIHLAGKAGKVLEHCLGPAVAGALIHHVSCPQLEGKVPDFYCDNDEALSDIKRLAELEPPLQEDGPR